MLTADRNNETTAALDLALMFKALGDPTRLKIFEFLREQCCPVAVDDTGNVRPVLGPTVGEVCCHVTGREGVSSVISFHLKELRLAGLIAVERRGKNMIYRVCPEAVERLAGYLTTPEPKMATGCC